MLDESRPLPAIVADLAFRRHGVVSRRQLLGAGVPASTVAAWVRQGRLHPLHRGVYAVGHRRISREARWLAGVLACGAGAVLSFGAAAQARGILRTRSGIAVHVSVPRRSGAGPDGVVVHRVRGLDPADVSAHLGIPATTGTRTIWDLATVLSPQALRRAFAQAEKLRVLDRDRLASLARSSPGRKGAGAVRAILAEPVLPLEETRSLLEELVLETCREASLPPPAVNVPLLGWEVDFLWRRERLVVEADGADHLDPAQRDRDNRRDAELARAGFLVRRWGTGPVMERRGVAAELTSLLSERGR